MVQKALPQHISSLTQLGLYSNPVKKKLPGKGRSLQSRSQLLVLGENFSVAIAQLAGLTRNKNQQIENKAASQ